MVQFSTYEFLKTKRAGGALSPRDIELFISGFTSGSVADYQMTAFLMAVAIQGMTPQETAALTRAMQRSGDEWHLRDRFDFIADKHSSGGVGDKVSLILTPWVAACGVKIGMLSGRGLGHTGGTLDKLESIRGFNARLSRAEIERCVTATGCAIATSTLGVAPADRRMYALRDVTATVDSLPLITASIMSKKLAFGASALILDVKYGSGAFMQTLEDARALARSLISSADQSGTRVEAMITNMDRPLGIAAGNANEMAESIEVLRGRGPRDVHELTKAQGVRILVMSGRFDEASAATALDEAIASGAALEKARQWIAAQEGDADVVDHPERLPQPSRTVEVRAPRSGYISAIDTRAAGLFIVSLGAGRMKAEDEVDHAAGVMFDRNVGDAVEAGETIARIQFGNRDVENAAEQLLASYTFAENAPPSRPLIEELLLPSAT